MVPGARSILGPAVLHIRVQADQLTMAPEGPATLVQEVPVIPAQGATGGAALQYVDSAIDSYARLQPSYEGGGA